MQSKIATILVNYNGLSDTIECIKSIQKSKFACHIIIVDNASEGSDVKILCSDYPNITVIACSTNGGFSYGNNIGIKWAIEHNFDFVLLLNNDTVVDEDMILRLLEYADDTTITVPSMFYHSKPDMLCYGGGFVNKITGSAKHKRINEIVEVDFMKPENCTFATGCCMLLSTYIIKKIGMLREDFFMYCEDTEFCIRAIKGGIKILYIPQAKLWHKVSSSTGGSGSAFNTYYMTRNRLWCIELHKDFFYATAKPFTLITRKILAIMSKNEKVREAFLRGIKDYQEGVIGKAAICFQETKS